MEENTFQQAVRNFAHDLASGDAVRHLADRGLTVTEITAQLAFPTKKELVTEMVWKHYLNTGWIRLEEPTGGTVRKVSYVTEEGIFGKTSLRQVVEEIPAPAEGYVRCSFGRELYRDREAFLKRLERLSASDREYILDLPWPLTDVWHVEDERMKRILQMLGEEDGK